jgi:hypothetical protein
MRYLFVNGSYHFEAAEQYMKPLLLWNFQPISAGCLHGTGNIGVPETCGGATLSLISRSEAALKSLPCHTKLPVLLDLAYAATLLHLCQVEFV